MVSRLLEIAKTLDSVAHRKFCYRELVVPEFVGRSAVMLDPLDASGASLRVTDTGVSIYIEALGAKWETDSAEHVKRDQARVPSFASQLSWAAETAQAVALYGLVRVRRVSLPFGRETHLLRQESDLTFWEQRPDFKITQRWSPW